MTPELAQQPDTTTRRPIGEGHLTEEQFGELIAASAKTAAADTSPAEAHLRSCEQCAAEIASLRECLSLFREASTAYADRELRRMPQVTLPARRPLLFPVLPPAYWVAAAAIFLAALLPLQTLHRHAVQPATAVAADASSAPVGSESDEALLEDVNREESASVPTPMQALADPTDGASSTSAGIETSNQTSDQRKD
jgi:anti-sigma factor RsiW